MEAAQLEMLLTDYLQVDKLSIGNNGWYRGCCPVHGERNPSWGIVVDSPVHLWKCFACGRGNLLSLVMLAKNLSREEALKVIYSYGEYEVPNLNSLVGKLPEFDNLYKTKEVLIPTYMIAPYEGKDLDKAEQVIGLKESYLRRLRWGMDRVRNRIIIPWFHDGELVSITGRWADTAVPEGAAKTIPYFGSAKGKHLYLPSGTIDSTRPLPICEGEKDAASVLRIQPNSSAPCFSAFTRAQAGIVLDSGVEDVVAMPDPDSGGEVFFQSVYAELSGKVKLWRAQVRRTDPGASTVRELYDAWCARGLITKWY